MYVVQYEYERTPTWVFDEESKSVNAAKLSLG